MLKTASVLVALAVAAGGSPAADLASTQYHRVHISTVTEGLDRPWGLAFLPDGRMLVTERAGRLRVVGKDGKLDPVQVAGLPRVDPQGQGGLLDVVLHPQYSANGWVYWSYAQKDASGENGTEVARGKLAGGPGAWSMESVEVLFRMAPKSSASLHFGSRIVFDRAGLMYVTLGERGDKDRAQKLDDHGGKIVRLTDDGKPAPGNPFSGDPKAKPEVFSLGHRNVQGAAIHPKTGVLWASEHGPQGGDELNVIKAGVNYGWPVITYGVNYMTGTKIGEGTEKPGMEQPIYYWDPVIAPGNIMFYTGALFPAWKGSLFIGGMASTHLVRLTLEGDKVVGEERLLTDLQPQRERIRDVRQGPDGAVYVATDNAKGRILKLVPRK
jgi:aldose sugar dehydrogenase